MEKQIFNELQFEDSETAYEVLKEMFDNSYENNKYIVNGTLGLWDGKREAHFPRVLNSIYEAILVCNDGFNGYITITEENYGKLYVDICHHDGNNHMEIKMLTKIGEEMNNNYKEVEEILKNKRATKNIRFLKNYWE